MKKEIKVRRDLDLWQYQMPYQSMTMDDELKAYEYGVLIQRSGIYDGDFLIGTWNHILDYMIEYLGYEMINEYMKPLYIEDK